jgi:hypothetical protein
MKWPSDSDVAAVSGWAHMCGGMTQYNHPAGPGYGLTREQVVAGKFDAVETMSGIFDARGDAFPYSQFCAERGLTATCGSDTHAPGDRPRVYMEILGMSPQNGTPRGVIDAIKEGRVRMHSHRESESYKSGGMDLGRIGLPRSLMSVESACTLPMRGAINMLSGRARF